MIDVTKLKVLHDNILVIGIQPKERDGIVRGITSDDKPEIGLVLKTGPGRTTENGEFIENKIQEGSYVIFNQYTTNKFNFNGETYYTLRSEDVIGFIDKEDFTG